VGFDAAFSFKYSPRPNTLALGMKGQVPEEEKGRRLLLMQEHQQQIQQRRNQALVGQTFEVLVEAYNSRQQQYVGRTTTNRVVNFAGGQLKSGDYGAVRVTRAGANSLVGTLVT